MTITTATVGQRVVAVMVTVVLTATRKVFIIIETDRKNGKSKERFAKCCCVEDLEDNVVTSL